MLYVAVYILIDRKYKNSRPDTKSEIQRNLSSRIIGNLLQSDPSGNLSVPLYRRRSPVSQQAGNSNWVGPQYWFGVGFGTTSPFQFSMKTSIGCTGIITTPDTTTSIFILAPGYTYKCACVLSCNQLVSSNIYYWWTTNNTTIGLFGVPAQAYNINI